MVDSCSNLESLQLSCRVCLQKGEINIWDFKVKIEPQEIIGTSTEINALELIQIVSKTDELELTEEFPLLCLNCIDDFKRCYIFYDKLQNATTCLKKLFNECINQYIEEEHLIESPEVDDLIESAIYENSVPELRHMEKAEIPLETIDLTEKDSLVTTVKSNSNHKHFHRSLDENSSLVVTQFVPVTKYFSPSTRPGEDNEEFAQRRNILTVDCQAVEIKDISILETLKIPSILDSETPITSSAPVYMCEYCPKAFAKSEFLTLHLQRTHICKFCTQPFHLAPDLYRHIRETHSVNKCAICQKVLSSSTNLRHHLRNVHSIKLPAKMTLLDVIQADDGNIGNSARTSTTIVAQW